MAPGCGTWVPYAKDIAPVLAAAAAATIGVIGWLAKTILEYATWRWGESSRSIKLMRAVRTEIVTNLTAERYWADDSTKKEILGAFDERGNIPYSLTTDEPPIIADIADQMDGLPGSTIAPAYAYYNLSAALDKQIKGLNSNEFISLEKPRQRRLLEGIFALASSCVRAGKRASRQLRKEIRAERKRQIALPWIFSITGVSAALLGGASLIQAAESVGACFASFPSRAISFELSTSQSGPK